MNRQSGRTLLILELAILLAFFVFAAVASCYMFVKADRTATEAEALDQAVVRTTSIAETLKATDGDLQKTGNRVAERKSYDVTDNQLLIYFDENMAPSSASGHVYVATVTEEKESKCKEYNIVIARHDDNTIIYDLTFRHVEEGGGH